MNQASSQDDSKFSTHAASPTRGPSESAAPHRLFAVSVNCIKKEKEKYSEKCYSPKSPNSDLINNVRVNHCTPKSALRDSPSHPHHFDHTQDREEPSGTENDDRQELGETSVTLSESVIPHKVSESSVDCINEEKEKYSEKCYSPKSPNSDLINNVRVNHCTPKSVLHDSPSHPHHFDHTQVKEEPSGTETYDHHDLAETSVLLCEKNLQTVSVLAPAKNPLPSAAPDHCGNTHGINPEDFIKQETKKIELLEETPELEETQKEETIDISHTDQPSIVDYSLTDSSDPESLVAVAKSKKTRRSSQRSSTPREKNIPPSVDCHISSTYRKSCDENGNLIRESKSKKSLRSGRRSYRKKHQSSPDHSRQSSSLRAFESSDRNQHQPWIPKNELHMSSDNAVTSCSSLEVNSIQHLPRIPSSAKLLSAENDVDIPTESPSDDINEQAILTGHRKDVSNSSCKVTMHNLNASKLSCSVREHGSHPSRTGTPVGMQPSILMNSDISSSSHGGSEYARSSDAPDYIPLTNSSPFNGAQQPGIPYTWPLPNWPVNPHFPNTVPELMSVNLMNQPPQMCNGAFIWPSFNAEYELLVHQRIPGQVPTTLSEPPPLFNVPPPTIDRRYQCLQNLHDPPKPSFCGYQLLGDSMLLRFSQQILRETSIAAESLRFLGYCVSGQKIGDLLRRLKSGFYHLGKRVVLMIGTNDLLRGTNLTQMKHELRKVVEHIWNESEELILLTLPPVPRLESSNFHWSRLHGYNDYIKELSTSDSRILVFDICPLYLLTQEELDEQEVWAEINADAPFCHGCLTCMEEDSDWDRSPQADQDDDDAVMSLLNRLFINTSPCIVRSLDISNFFTHKRIPKCRMDCFELVFSDNTRKDMIHLNRKGLNVVKEELLRKFRKRC